MSQLNVAVVELTSTDEVAFNLDQISQLISKVDAVDLICLPENCLYFRIDKASPMIDFAIDDPAIQKLQMIVEHKQTALMLGSIPLRENGYRTNASVLLEPGKLPQVLYRKLNLFDVDVSGAPSVRESDVFRHGSESRVFEFHGWKIGLSICYDIRFPELYLQYALCGVDLVLIPAAFLVPTGRAHWEILIRARAIESQCFVVAAAQGGEHIGQNGETRHTYGHSLVVGPWGEVLLQMAAPKKIEVVKLDKNVIEKVRRQIPMSYHRRSRRWEIQS
jgi:predicted amidohydrolase